MSVMFENMGVTQNDISVCTACEHLTYQKGSVEIHRGDIDVGSNPNQECPNKLIIKQGENSSTSSSI